MLWMSPNEVTGAETKKPIATGTNRDAMKLNACVSIDRFSPLDDKLQITFHSKQESQIDDKSAKHFIASQRKSCDCLEVGISRVLGRSCVQIRTRTVRAATGIRSAKVCHRRKR